MKVKPLLFLFGFGICSLSGYSQKKIKDGVVQVAKNKYQMTVSKREYYSIFDNLIKTTSTVLLDFEELDKLKLQDSSIINFLQVRENYYPELILYLWAYSLNAFFNALYSIRKYENLDLILFQLLELSIKELESDLIIANNFFRSDSFSKGLKAAHERQKSSSSNPVHLDTFYSDIGFSFELPPIKPRIRNRQMWTLLLQITSWIPPDAIYFIKQNYFHVMRQLTDKIFHQILDNGELLMQTMEKHFGISKSCFTQNYIKNQSDDLLIPRDQILFDALLGHIDMKLYDENETQNVCKVGYKALRYLFKKFKTSHAIGFLLDRMNHETPEDLYKLSIDLLKKSKRKLRRYLKHCKSESYFFQVVIYASIVTNQVCKIAEFLPEQNIPDKFIPLVLLYGSKQLYNAVLSRKDLSSLSTNSDTALPEKIQLAGETLIPQIYQLVKEFPFTDTAPLLKGILLQDTNFLTLDDIQQLLFAGHSQIILDSAHNLRETEFIQIVVDFIFLYEPERIKSLLDTNLATTPPSSDCMSELVADCRMNELKNLSNYPFIHLWDFEAIQRHFFNNNASLTTVSLLQELLDPSDLLYDNLVPSQETFDWMIMNSEGNTNRLVLIKHFLDILQPSQVVLDILEHDLDHNQFTIRLILASQSNPIFIGNEGYILRSHILEFSVPFLKEYHKSSVGSLFQSLISSITGQQSRLNIEFIGEKGSDFGGLTREYLNTASKELLNRKVLQTVEFMHEDKLQKAFFFSQRPKSGLSFFELYLELAGFIYGKAFALSQPIEGKMPEIAYALLQNPDDEIFLDDIEFIDATFFKHLMILSKLLEDPLAENEWNLTQDNFDDRMLDSFMFTLRDQSILTFDRLSEYISEQLEDFFEAFFIFKKSFLRTISPRNFENYSLEEIVYRMHGSAELCPDAILEHARFRFIDQKTKDFFVEYISCPETDLAQLLRFWTGTSSLFTEILVYGNGISGNLPIAATCSMRLTLASYVSFESLKENLNMAIHNIIFERK